MPTDLFELTLEGARHPVTGKIDSHLILPRTLIVPKNSNIQVVYSDIIHSLERAKRFKPPFREYAIRMALADLEGMISISSEQGAFIREFNTVRSSVPVGQVQGQPATWFDEYVYGKQKLKNNPKTEDLGIGF
jgi:hypothetical protein